MYLSYEITGYLDSTYIKNSEEKFVTIDNFIQVILIPF